MKKLEAMKETHKKLRMELIPPEVLWAYAEMLDAGAKKYAPRNWEKGHSRDTVYAALMRHLTKWRLGYDLDTESGLLHMQHILFWAAAGTKFSIDGTWKVSTKLNSNLDTNFLEGIYNE